MNRTVSTFHLVLGIIFSGIAALWFISEATDADWNDTAPGFPLVLIGAGVIGLVASLVNLRLRRQDPAPAYETEPVEPAGPPETDELTEDTTVLTHDESSEEKR